MALKRSMIKTDCKIYNNQEHSQIRGRNNDFHKKIKSETIFQW